ncbi:MAG: hypothetical protein ACI9WU_004296 [Myxococcota bacterium]|jgi:hypothetical protein
MATETARARRMRRLRGLLFNLGVAAVIIGGLELYFRFAHSPSPGLTEFIFLDEMSRDRWAYIMEGQADDLEASMAEVVPKRTAGTRELIEPEVGRPPHDRIRRSFWVQNNSDGFRDADFTVAKAAGTRRVLVIGDSVAWGKGLPRGALMVDIVRAALPEGGELFNLAYPACGIVCQSAFLNEFMGHAPDLVIIQPSGNDMDHSTAREATQGGAGWIGAQARQLVGSSRALQALAYTLFGKAKTGQIDAAVDATTAYYADELKSLFDNIRDNGAKAVVISLPGAGGHRYGGHVANACEQRKDVCLGVVDLDLEHPERWIPGFDSLREAHPTADTEWVSETALHFGLDPEALAQIFPLQHFFFDIVHPNHLANELGANQLIAFLKERWSGWDGGS